MQDRRGQDKTQSDLEEKVIQISRVSKKTKGGNNMGFSVLMVVGDKKGNVGVGLGKAKDVVSAMRKASKKAKKKMIKVPLNGTTIPFAVTVKKGAGRVMLKPAPKGSGVIAGGPIRAVVEAAGVRDISSKILGSDNQASSVYATFEALNQIRKIVTLKGISLKSIADVEAEAEAQMKIAQEEAKAHAQEKAAEEAKKAKVEKKPAAKVEKKAAPKAKPAAAPKVAKKEVKKAK
ncbi:MAG: small subunit ribosomal protein [Patescibacteria group bacterium]|jgi:small subunit ribosomal protein S5|nr:small subunit ribosomal protein [Patescibacteria group bacterium]